MGYIGASVENYVNWFHCGLMFQQILIKNIVESLNIPIRLFISDRWTIIGLELKKKSWIVK